MNKKATSVFSKIISLVLIGFLIWSVGALYISNHEIIHKDIFNNYNIPSNISINYLILSGQTMPDSYDKCTEICFFEHFLVELTGYYLVVIIYFTTILVLIIFLLKKNE